MSRVLSVAALATCGLMYSGSAALASEGQRTNSVLLNGEWEFVRGNGKEAAEKPANQVALGWKKVTLPGQLLKWEAKLATSVKFVWVRRSFTVSADQAKGLAVLRWNRISLGATAYINGRKVGWNEPTGPYQVILPAGLLKTGENQIVLRVCGAAGVRKAKSGYFLFAAGFATCHKRGMPAITDDVWIDFAKDAYVKWALAIPDLAASKVRIRVTLSGPKALTSLKIAARVTPWPKGEVAGRGKTTASFKPVADPLGSEHITVDVPMPRNFKPWTHEQRNLYVAEVVVLKDKTVLDQLTFRFGMREIKVADGNYKLNGKNLWLRGSNLVFEWDWGDTVTGKEKDYLVTEAREMSMNSFRTHTQPPPKLWSDICDEHGTMILAELPLLYNYRKYNYTPEEYKIFHRNCLTDAAGWITRLWNHPSVVMWVLSNESRDDNRWERGAYQNFVNKLDPTRPTMRTGTDGTKENYDVHTCGNISRQLDEGELIRSIPLWFRKAKGRTVSNSEYMNNFGRSRVQWVGKDDKKLDALAVAQLGAEHTEAMRRAQVDAILPYMYAGWTRTRRSAPGYKGAAMWKANFATPLSAVWHSSLSPILASLDLFDANYVAGQEVTTKLHPINETWHDKKVRVDLILTRECPGLVPEAKCFEAPVARWGVDYILKADSIRVEPVKWTLPKEPGSYWLTARTTGAKKRPVLSQRFVRAVPAPAVPEKLKARTIVVLGGDAKSAAWFKAKGLKTISKTDALDPKQHTAVIWSAESIKPAEKRALGKLLCTFAAAGGKVAVLRGHMWSKWEWKTLCDVTLSAVSGSRAFFHKGAKHPALRGVGRDWLMRWNGLPGSVAIGGIDGPAMKDATKLLWVRDTKTTVMAEVPAATGGGTILFSRLRLHHRVSPGPTYDPVAETILINILAR
jgi:glycosyl hydrolase family 2